MSEYAFDIKLFAVVRINTESIQTAKASLADALDCANLKFVFEDGGWEGKIAEASISTDDEDGPNLFEIDGVAADPYGDPYDA